MALRPATRSVTVSPFGWAASVSSSCSWGDHGGRCRGGRRRRLVGVREGLGQGGAADGADGEDDDGPADRVATGCEPGGVSTFCCTSARQCVIVEPHLDGRWPPRFVVAAEVGLTALGVMRRPDHEPCPEFGEPLDAGPRGEPDGCAQRVPTRSHIAHTGPLPRTESAMLVDRRLRVAHTMLRRDTVGWFAVAWWWARILSPLIPATAVARDAVDGQAP